MHAPVVTTGRDLRLDLFRGLALWLIFLDHIPSNLVAWITIRNYGFSDATEIFVFISGYTATFVNPLFSEEMDLLEALKEPGSTLVRALLLTFQPPNLDILPLYIVLLAG